MPPAARASVGTEQSWAEEDEERSVSSSGNSPTTPGHVSALLRLEMVVTDSPAEVSSEHLYARVWYHWRRRLAVVSFMFQAWYSSSTSPNNAWPHQHTALLP